MVEHLVDARAEAIGQESLPMDGRKEQGVWAARVAWGQGIMDRQLSLEELDAHRAAERAREAALLKNAGQQLVIEFYPETGSQPPASETLSA